MLFIVAYDANQQLLYLMTIYVAVRNIPCCGLRVPVSTGRILPDFVTDRDRCQRVAHCERRIDFGPERVDLLRHLVDALLDVKRIEQILCVVSHI